MRTFLKILLGLLLSWIGAMCALTAIHESLSLPGNWLCCTFIMAFIAGIFIFRKWRFVPFYVFGHEMTHFLTAKLFLKKTGKIKLHRTHGSVEVFDGNVWIVLAPYIVPFYAILAVAVYGLASLFLQERLLDLVFAALAALGYAYHVVLTCHALKLQQSDLDVYGPFLSGSIIFSGNMLLILIAILVFSRTWKNALSYMQEITMVQADLVHSLIKCLH